MPRLSRSVARRRLLAAAVGGYLLGCAVALAGWHYAQAARAAADAAAFGRTTAQDVALLAVEPLMRQDRVALGLAASRVAERPQVRGITVHTVDGEAFAVVGEAVPPGSPAFAAPIAVQDSVVGRVTVTLNQGAFGLSLAGLLRSAWWWLAAGLLLAAAGGQLADRRRSPSPVVEAQEEASAEAATPSPTVVESVEEAEPAEKEGGPFLLVANLFARAGQPPEDREEALGRGFAVAEAVAGQTGAEAEALEDVGVALRFPGEAQDAAYAAVRGALLLRTAMDEANLPPFRYALEQVAATSAAPTEGVAIMASVAADGQLVLGADAAGQLAQTERLQLETAESAAAMVLPPPARPSQVVLGIGAEEEAELARQAGAIAGAV